MAGIGHVRHHGNALRLEHLVNVMRPVAHKIRAVLSHEGSHHLSIKKAGRLQRGLTNEWRALRGTQVVSLPLPPPASRNAWRSPRPLFLPVRAPHNWGGLSKSIMYQSSGRSL